ncbi:WD40-repeat-containing domain protein [Auriculariales sp. MPI-PUGE-AT-0066]|nr:WD40-repeat-containing domain protein [Auriculariales sp. MPI-PUGE-AT-0066]
MHGEESALRQVLESTQTQMHVDLGRILARVTTSEAKLLSALSIVNSGVGKHMCRVNGALDRLRLVVEDVRTNVISLHQRFNPRLTPSPNDDTRRGLITPMSISDDVRIVQALIEGTSSTLTPAPSRDGSVVRIHNDSEHIQINASLPALRATGSALLCTVTKGMTPANGMAITMVMALASRDTQSRYFFSFLTGILWLIHQHWLVVRFSQPDVPHVIFIIDFFDSRHLIPFEKVSSSSNLHNALLELFRGRMGESLLLARNYELVRAPTGGSGTSQELLSSSWETPPCHPGEEVHMNALMFIRMQKQIRRVWTRCPACDTEMVSTCADKDGWVRWCITSAFMKLPLKLDSVRCPTRFEVRDVQEKPARSRMAPNSSFETTTSNSANSDTSLEDGSDVEGERRDHDNWQQDTTSLPAAEVQMHELQRFKRIRVLQIQLDSNHTLGIHLDELDPRSWPAEYRKSGHNWTALFNPNVPRQLDVSLSLTFTHGSTVRCVKFSADGRYLATGCGNAAHIYDMRTGEKTYVSVKPSDLQNDSDYIDSVAWSPDGKYLATGGTDTVIRLWDIGRKRIRHVYQGHRGCVRSLDFSGDGSLIVSGSGDGTVRVWERDSSKVLSIHEPFGPDVYVYSVAMSPDGRHVAAGGSWDTVVHIWDVATGLPVERLMGHSRLVTCVSFTPDGNGLLSVSWGGNFNYWDVSRLCRQQERGGSINTGESSVTCINDFRSHTAFVTCGAISREARYIVSGSRDGMVQFWDARTAQIQMTLHGHKCDSASRTPSR